MTVISSPLLAPEDIVSLRSDSGVQGWVAPFYVYSTQAIGRFFAFMCLAYSIQNKHKIGILFSIFFILTIFIGLLANLSKSAAFVFLFQVLFLITLIRNYKIHFGNILLFIAGFVTLLIFIYLFVTVAESSSDALNFMTYRIFKEPNRVLNLYTEYYPKIYPHTYGLNIRLIYNVFGDGEFVSSDVILSDGRGTLNAFFVGDAWVDFSYIGVIIESFFLGIYMAFLDHFVFKEKNLITKVTLTSLVLGIFALPSVAMLACMITFGLLSVPILSKIIRLKPSHYHL